MGVHEERIPQVSLVTVRQLLPRKTLLLLTHFRQPLLILFVEAVVTVS
jgi:hypothetical protein